VSPYGTVTVGRQYTLVNEMGYTHDIYAFSNYTGTTGFQGAGETGGGRLDKRSGATCRCR